MMINFVHNYFQKKDCLLNKHIENDQAILQGGGIGACQKMREKSPFLIDEK